MKDHHRKFLEDYYDGNCPVCEESFEKYEEHYPESEAQISGEVKCCARATLNSNAPDPLLEVYHHEQT